MIDPGELGQQFQQQIDFSKTMIIGIDVTHPSQNEQVSSSIAAAVGSIDQDFTQYTASIRIQEKERCEIIETNLEAMIGELLKEYQKKNGQYPENLVIFRDGVSESQFSKVLDCEVKQVENVVKKVVLRSVK